MESELFDLLPHTRQRYLEIIRKGGIRGAEGEGDGGDEGGEGDEGGDDGGDDGGEKNPLGFSPEQQAAFNRAMARERRNSTAKAQKDLLESLGLEKPDDLKAAIERDRKRRTDEMSELEKAQEAARKAEAKAAEAEAKAARMVVEGKVDRALISSGVEPKKVSRVRGMLGEFGVDAEDEAIEEAVEELKQDFPDLFTEAVKGEEDDDDGEDRGRRSWERTAGPPRSDPGRQMKSKRPPKDKRELARTKLAERHPYLVDDE